jgi:hypothetical protein
MLFVRVGAVAATVNGMPSLSVMVVAVTPEALEEAVRAVMGAVLAGPEQDGGEAAPHATGGELVTGGCGVATDESHAHSDAAIAAAAATGTAIDLARAPYRAHFCAEPEVFHFASDMMIPLAPPI